MLGHMVDEHAQLGRDATALGPQQPERPGMVGEVVEHLHEVSLGELPAQGEIRQTGDAEALFGKIARRQ